MQSEPLVSVIIVNWNSRYDLAECITSLKNSEHKNSELIIIDNASTDDSVDFIRNNYNNILLIRNEINLGFTAANNIGASLAKGKYIFLLNSDAVINQTTITKLVCIMESDPLIGACGSKVYFDHDKYLINCAGHFVDNLGFLWARGYMKKDAGQYAQCEDVFMCSACSLMIRKDFIEKYGLFDKSLFMYGDELELALKIWGSGYRIVFVPESIVFHKHSRGSSKVFNPHPTPFKQFFANRNRVKIAFKYFPLKLLIRNFHLMIISLFYWDIYILKNEGIVRSLNAIFSQVIFAIIGISQRKETKCYNANAWAKYVINHSLFDYISLAFLPQKIYLGIDNDEKI